MNIKYEHLIILILFGIIVFLSTCNDTKIITEEVEVVRVDSVFTSDTIIKHHTKYISNVPELINTPHAPFNIDLSDTNDLSDTFYYGVKDSLLEATILVHTKSKPDSIGFDYDLKSFTIHDSIYVRDSVYQENKKSYLSFGGSVYVGNDFGLIPTLFYTYKATHNFGLGYDVINKSYQLTYSKRLFK